MLEPFLAHSTDLEKLERAAQRESEAIRYLLDLMRPLQDQIARLKAQQLARAARLDAIRARQRAVRGEP